MSRAEYKRAYRVKNADKLNAQERARYAKDPEKFRASSKAHRDNNPEKWAATLARYTESHAEEIRDRKYQKQYGITVADYDAMLEQQDGVCAICKQPEKTTRKDGKVPRLAIDHCHDSGHVRRLLCGKCNLALGLLGHDPDVLRAAADYCEGH